MAIDIDIEKLVTLTEATKLLPRVGGKRVHVSTLWRWCRKGLRGVNLEYLRVGSRIATSHEAMKRFFEALTQLDENQVQSSFYKPACLKSRSRTDKARQRSIEEANAILIKAGIIRPTAHREATKT
jgi:hypothetical protein